MKHGQKALKHRDSQSDAKGIFSEHIQCLLQLYPSEEAHGRKLKKSECLPPTQPGPVARGSSSPCLQWVQLKSPEEDEVTQTLSHIAHEGSPKWGGKMAELHWEGSDDMGSCRGGKGQCEQAEEDGSVSTSKCP